MALGIYVLTDIKSELTSVNLLLTNHRINHPTEGLSSRVIVLEQQVKANLRNER